MSGNIDDLRKDVLEYIGVKLDLIRLHMAENLSRILSNAAVSAVIGCLLFLIILFVSLAAAYFIGSRKDSNELGFLFVAGFYLLILVLFLLFRKHIIPVPKI